MRADADPSWLRKTGLGVSLGLHAALPVLALLAQAPALTTPPMPDRGLTMLTLLPPSPTPSVVPAAPAPPAAERPQARPEPRARPPTPEPPSEAQAILAAAMAQAAAASAAAAVAAASEPAALTALESTAAPAPASAPAASSNLGVVEFPMSYLARMSRTITNRIHYPAGGRDSGQQGTAFVRVRLARSGAVLEATLLETSGSSVLDEEARNVILRIGQFRPIPEEVMPQQSEFVIHQPVQFALR
jgi:protein TonB